MALQGMTLKYRMHSMHTMKRLLLAQLNKSATFSKHPAKQNWCFDYENNNKLQRMTPQTVRNKNKSACIKFLINNFDWIFLELY